MVKKLNMWIRTLQKSHHSWPTRTPEIKELFSKKILETKWNLPNLALNISFIDIWSTPNNHIPKIDFQCF